MMNTKRLDLTAGALLIVPGIALTLLSTHFDSFVKGMCQGAGVMLMLIGVWLIGSRLRRPRSEGDASMWLPSRDAQGTKDDTGTDPR